MIVASAPEFALTVSLATELIASPLLRAVLPVGYVAVTGNTTNTLIVQTVAGRIAITAVRADLARRHLVLRVGFVRATGNTTNILIVLLVAGDIAITVARADLVRRRRALRLGLAALGRLTFPALIAVMESVKVGLAPAQTAAIKQKRNTKLVQALCARRPPPGPALTLPSAPPAVLGRKQLIPVILPFIIAARILVPKRAAELPLGPPAERNWGLPAKTTRLATPGIINPLVLEDLAADQPFGVLTPAIILPAMAKLAPRAKFAKRAAAWHPIPRGQSL